METFLTALSHDMAEAARLAEQLLTASHRPTEESFLGLGARCDIGTKLARFVLTLYRLSAASQAEGEAELVERVIRVAEAHMFAPHELPVDAELHEKYLYLAKTILKEIPLPSQQEAIDED